ncbi:phosphatidate cytidylyltransferase [Motilimonas pumila]|uniref:Phosphatidate cytidylyltransferase n=1 Tax=Motilimonas pumila TaxID=2303987 RepID=A0A418YGW7_9GAMM|nr:phosphatidate cytidylyltransferase [Motilimonas pumila]RJG49067.1 phosphatidate cytidylyltransferase [Motilimonas pumila]
MLKQRILTAAVLAPITIAAIFFLPLKLFALFAAAVYLLAAREWGGFVNRSCQSWFIYPLGLILAATLVVVPIDAIWVPHLHQGAKYLLIVGGAWWLLSAIMVLSYPTSSSIWTKNAWFKALFGILTLVPFFWSLVTLRGADAMHDPLHGAWLVLFVMLLVWGADTGAYFSGKALGKHKLAPKVSPGKTIEGFVGGLLTTLVVAIIAMFLFEIPGDRQGYFIFSAVMASLASTLGDLNESMFKREAGLKDSGNLLPGHGGVMDRIDSLTAALPVFTLCYIVWFNS